MCDNLSVHFYRDYENPKDRRSKIHEVDFVAERLDGSVLPIESKFRKRISPEDAASVSLFMDTFKAPLGIVVTRETSFFDAVQRLLFIPLQDFLVAF